MKKIKKYIKISLKILSMSHQRATAYRADYVLRVLRAFLDVGVAYVSINVFYFRSPSILGWNKWEALVVYGFFQTISTLVFIFSGYGISTLAREIIWGSLDRLLTQPIDSQFFASFKISYVTNIFRLVFGLLILFLALSNLGITYSPLQIIMTIISSLSSVIIYYSLTFGVTVLSFWTFSYELGELMSTITSITRFPTDFFSKGIKFAMHIVPLAFISTVPAKVLIWKNYSLAAISPIIALISFILIRKLWHLGLRSYQSASS